MSARLFLWVLVLMSLCQHSVSASEKRAKIGLVLAGGGAKGAAHIGVLKALEELHVPVDYITGTSMGAYVAGLYATGISADKVEQVVNSIDWNKGYRDRIDRGDRRVRDKEFEDRYQLKTELGLSVSGIVAPKGVIQGQSMARILRDSVGYIPQLNSFDALAIPFRSVATDIVDLKAVVIDHGHLVDAMMASMSVPGVLPPYQYNHQLLVDGGVTDNMPVDVAKQMGADKVIAIDISTDYRKLTEFTDLLAVADQLSNYLVRKSTQQQIELLSGDDIYLKPDVGHMETTEFDRMNEAYEKGYQAVMAHRAAFEKLALSTEAYQAYQDKKLAREKKLVHPPEWRIDAVRIQNRSHYNDEVLKKLLDIPVGETLSSRDIEARVDALYAFDRYEFIAYHIQQEGDKNVLVVLIREKSWGPNYGNFRFSLEDDFDSQSNYSLGASVTFTNLDTRGSEFRLDMEMGTDRRMFGELYVPITDDQTFFSTASITYQKDERHIAQDGVFNSSLQSTEDYYSVDYLEFQGELALGYQNHLWDEVKFGMRLADGVASLSDVPAQSDYDYTRKGIFVGYRIDTLDSYALPNNGVYFDFDYLVSEDQLAAKGGSNSGDSDYTDTVYELSSSLVAAKSFGRHTVVGHLDYGVIRSKKSTLPIYPKTLGGFLHLSGIPKDSLIGDNKAFSSLVYRYRWFDNDFGLFTSPVYIGASLEYGGVWSDSTLSLHDAPLYNAGSIFAGIDSPIGPIMFGYGRTEHNYSSVYLVVGNAFK